MKTIWLDLIDSANAIAESPSTKLNSTVEQAYNKQNDRLWLNETPAAEKRTVGHSQHSKQVMVWAGICFGDKLPLVFVDPGLRFNQAFYRQRILREVVRPWTQHRRSRFWIFQQDGAPPHTARLTQAWLRRNTRDSSIKIMAPRSPDLNPLDYSVWSILEERACREPHQNIESLRQALQFEWNKIQQSTLELIVDDFPRRIEACIRAGGRHFE
uniref:Transposase n=1 Tax=Ditylenchus dipsaci TaxID=166011 RepID=A0A915CWZ0_9BILA